MTRSPPTFSDSETIGDTNPEGDTTIQDQRQTSEFGSGNTSNLIAHLRDKYNTSKDNYSEYLDEREKFEASPTRHHATNYSHTSISAPPSGP
ncbi:hypothetical protein RclHR1_01450021 [Rhizophagus clarus]|uniref:Uncharacterized protein n=1 Tax=Rhizophagus clarus TaxID=94130 RepID=A0A2Z6QCW3_9GLOM|nr:hypothetical protein RclHR1_01450021 [Rhizophagus clarus]